MLEKNLKDYVAAPFRTRIHEEWYLSASENEKLKATKLIWTPGTKLPPVDPEPQVAHASSPRQGQKRAQSASETTGDKDKECRGAHKKHKTSGEGGTSHHKGAEESSSHALQRDASDVSFRPARPERPLTPPEINNIPSATPISHALRPISFDPLSSSRRMYSYQEKVSMGAALASHDCLQEPAVTGDLSVLSHTNFITRGKTLVKDMEYDVAKS
ncbi:hypothetical protein VKT23_000508 [Stygiomarasmius scandens]|uniref:Uncharacterized protein n=1 Tax=Marasmiellus scandens TaxID=2682957 RepID=A0ABR1K4A0_9AGAR